MAVGREHDAEVLLAEHWAHELYFALAVVARVVGELRCIEDDGVGLLVEQELIGVADLLDLEDVDLAGTQVVSGGTAAGGRYALSGEVIGPAMAPRICCTVSEAVSCAV